MQVPYFLHCWFGSRSLVFMLDALVSWRNTEPYPPRVCNLTHWELSGLPSKSGTQKHVFDVHGSAKSSFITIDHKTSRIRPILVKNAEHWRLAKFCSSKLYRLSDRLNISTVVFSGDGIDRKIDTTLRICGLVEGGGWGGNAQKCVSLEARMNKKDIKILWCFLVYKIMMN